MEAVAIIPARGGSKRLPGKNVRLFGGIPLIAHSIWQARQTSRISRCIVSTDDDAIADIAVKWGAEVMRRPADLASDQAKTGPVLQHALTEVARGSAMPDAVVLLQPTNPLRPISIIEETLRRLQATDADSVITVSRSHLKLGQIVSGLFVPNYAPGVRSQDLASSFYENGLVYATRSRVILEGDVFGQRIGALETDDLYAADIDTLTDFEVAEFLFNRHRTHFNAPEIDL